MLDSIVIEWVEKAEGDWKTLERLQGDHLLEVADSICFHSQQCSEKYLKALIQSENLAPPRTHHLPRLLDMIVSIHSELEFLRSPCEELIAYGVLIRYPGETATEEDAMEAFDLSKRIRKTIRAKLGL